MNQFLAPTRPLCILHSDDTDLRQLLAGSMQDRAYICHAPDQHRLEELLGGSEALLLFVDLRLEGALELIHRLSRVHPQAVLVALGHPGSDAFSTARDMGVYRAEDLAASRAEVRDMVDRAIERVGWMQETQMLRDEVARLRAAQQHSVSGAGRGGQNRNPIGLQNLVKATQQLDRLEGLFEKIVDGVSSAALVSRVGLFYRQDGQTSYRLQAGRCCLDDTHAMEFSDRDPLVRWLQRHPRLITRSSLDHISDPSERSLLRRSLDLLGAETFIPLNLRGRVLGWLFTGQTDGFPFDHQDHPQLSFLSEHVVTALENAIKHQEALSQKALGENLLQLMPTAILTVDAEGFLTWCNAPAEQMFPAVARDFARSAPSASGRPGPRVAVESLGNRVASLLRDALAGEPTREPRFLESQSTGGRALAMRTRQLTAAGRCFGAVALIDDITDQLQADAQQEQIERTRFWRELAAGISHEIRNPLVAIKTFTQLLPKRYDDEDFRLEFREMVSREVGRLDNIVAQIEGFAHPSVGTVDSADLATLLQEAADSARAATEAVDAQIKISADEGLPRWLGDAKALVQGFHHLFVNGIEAAMTRKTRAMIKVRMVGHRSGGEIHGFKLAITDNGPGMAASALESAFSPFFSTKAQGLGLGLPIAQRVLLDHGGKIELDSGSAGLCVNITLPLEPPGAPLAAPSLPAGNASAGQSPLSDAESAKQAALGYAPRMRIG